MMTSEKVVACGMSGRLPESDNLEELWRHLINKDDMVSRDCRRGDTEFLGLPKGSGKLKDLSRFDANFFGMLPKQVQKTDPHLRILLEVAYETIIDAGFHPQELKGSQTGVYVASTFTEAGLIYTGDLQAKEGYGYTSTLPSHLSNRLSYFFDLKGPSSTTDAACATGLIVVHNAVKDILCGECDYALVCGVVTNLRPHLTYTMFQLQILSPDGYTKAFDKSADGFGRSEAIVAIFITRESLCRRAYGYLTHSATNHAGFVIEGITVPSTEAQERLLNKAYSQSGICTDDVEYIEAHATGTSTGDPVEANVIHSVFCKNRTRDRPLLIGTLKSNLGHCECVAGLSSLLKVLMTINHGIIPPNLNFNTPNPSIKGLMDGTLKVVTEPTKYMGGPIGINSFGFGGVNVHLIVKPFNVSNQNFPCAIPRILLSSSRTKECVKDNLSYLASHKADEAFHHLATQVAKSPVEGMPYRGYKILNSTNPIEEVKKVDKLVNRPVWFIFTGMGSQWAGMGKDLMVLETFRNTILKCHSALEATDQKIQLMDLIMNGTKEKVEETIPAFVTTISIQVALVNCLKDLGVLPSGIMGHSMGETCCSFADGLLSEEQTIMAIYWRGRCVLDSYPPSGRMASVALGWEEVKRRIPEGIVAACHNAEDNTTVSGNTEAVQKFVSELQSEGVFAREVNTNHIAYHSPDMFPVAPALQKELEKIVTFQAPRSASWVSTSVPEGVVDGDERQRIKTFTSSYLVNNLISPVLFYDAIRKIPSNAIVIEIAPHGLLERVLKKTLHEDCEYISLMNRKEQDNLNYFQSRIGKLFTLGVSLDLNKLYPPVQYPLGVGTPMLSPGIKWDHSIEWDVPSWEDFIEDPSVTTKRIDIDEGGVDAFLKDHNIDGRVLYPATGYIHLAWWSVAKIMKTKPENLAIDFSDLTFHRATVIPESGSATLTVRIVPSVKFFDISENDEVTASGKYKIPEEPFFPVDQNLNLDTECFMLSREDIYKELRLIGYNYGPKFQGIKKANTDGRKALLEWNGNWITFLDSVLQVTILGNVNPSKSLYLPIRIHSLRINPKFHKSQTTRGVDTSEIPAAVDIATGTCVAGGVQLTGLRTSVAPKRRVKQNPTMEAVEFVPYGKIGISPRDDILEYRTVCQEYLTSYQVKKVLNGQEVKILSDVHTKLTSNPTDEESGYLKVLCEIGKVNKSKDLVKGVWNIIDTHALQLAHDKLLTFLLKSHLLKNLLDVVWENSTTRKIKVIELGARYGGLFIHMIPCMMSQPLLQLEYTATDPDVEKLSMAFKTQLNTMNVKTAFLDVNEELISGLDHKNLVAVRGLSQQSQSILKSLQNIHAMLADGGFLLLHEITSNFDLHLGFDELIFETYHEDLCDNRGFYLTCSEWEDKLKKCGFELIQQVSDGISSTLFLCRKRRQEVFENNHIFISVSEKEFYWVEEVKNELNNLKDKDNSGNIWLISENDYSSGIVGMVNCLREEDGGQKNQVRCVLNASFESKFIDISKGPSAMKKLMDADLVMNVFKHGSWGSYRHQFFDKDEVFKDTPNAYANIVTPGDLSSLTWFQLPMATALQSPDHVLCNVKYSSLNFKDVMIASGKIITGILSDDVAHEECLIGLEFAGHDPYGKRVMGVLRSQGLATHVSAEAHLLFDVPESWSLEEAATVPLVYSTVYYALVVRGQVKRKESILIHCGSGGIGQAAIAVALSYGCKVYTTVGTEKKRSFLMKKFPTLHETCFASSRNLSFEKHVMEQTNGVGVNLVLNSLSGEMFDASLRCLSKHGRFLEIGKYDLSRNKQVGSFIFLNNTTFHGIHLDFLVEKGNREWLATANLMKEGLRNGVVKPLPRMVFARDEVDKAFRYMGQGKHIGKILIQINSDKEEANVSRRALSVKVRQSCNPYKVYIIVGGLGGFGLEVADWLVSRDCKKLVLTSRSGIRSGHQTRRVKRLQSLGVSVTISKLDASEKNECYELLRQSQEMGPIGGIFNLAMVLKDRVLENLTPEDFEEVCKPKIGIAYNLDQASRHLCGSEMEWFVMFSSVSSGRGNAGQSNYGYANSAMERLCERRRDDQLPGLAIQWGVIGDVGVVADSETGNDTVIVGCAAQMLPSCLSTLDLFLSSTRPVLSSFIKACEDKGSDGESSRYDINQFLAKYFGIEDISSVSQDVTLAELGLDSILGVEVKQALERDFSTVLSMSKVRELTLRQLVNDFSNQRFGGMKENDNHDDVSLNAPLPLISPILTYKANDCLVPLNKGKDGNPPVFLIHPIEGSIDVFRTLATKLIDFPVYALLFTQEVPNDSVSNIARYYLSKMRSAQPNGQYNIAGYSFGAVIALEIALFIQNDGDVNSKTNLMLLDGSPSFALTRTRFIIEKRYPLDEEEIHALGPCGTLEVQCMIHIIQVFRKTPFNETKRMLLQKPTYKERLDLADSTLLAVVTNANEEDLVFSIDSYVKRSLAMIAYQPNSTWNMDIALFKAELCNKELLKRVGSTDYDLSKLCSGNVHIHQIAGDHESILNEPGVTQVATVMKDYLSSRKSLFCD